VAGRVIEVHPHRNKFTLAYLLLAAVVGVAATIVAVYELAPGTRTLRPSSPASTAAPAAWGAFRPQGFLTDQVQQIGTFVGASYRLPGGHELVAVKAAVPATVQNSLLVTDYAVSSTTGGSTSYDVVPATNAVSYELCGLGRDCAIAEGKPSIARERLLRREALELALYTFHYEPVVQSVVTYLPSKPGVKPVYALLFQRAQLAGRLVLPLTATLPESTPPQPDAIPPHEAATIDGLTAPDLYRFSFTRGQDGGVWVVFDPPTG
jgi:hypothetical protein